YLWYTATSRAMDDLKIYVNQNKSIWPFFYFIPNHLYELHGNPYLFKNIIFIKNNDSIILFHVREIIKNLNIENLNSLEALFPVYFKDYNIFNSNYKNIKVLDFQQFNSLYNEFIRPITQYY